MPRHVAFLRGINLGRRRVKMARLREHFEELGLDNVASWIASGNVAFDHPDGDASALEPSIERHLADALGFETDTFVRPMDRLAALVGRDDLSAAREEGFTPHVVFLRDEAAADVRRALDDLETADDRFVILGREVVWLRRGRLTDSTIENRHLEAALGAENTMRKLDTVERIVEKLGAGSG